MTNVSSFNWNINQGDYIYQGLNLERYEKREKLEKGFYYSSLVIVLILFMLVALSIAASI